MSSFDCSEVESEASAFLDGALSPSRQSAIERHLGECAACARIVSEYRDVSSTLKTSAYRRAPPGLAEDIRAKIQREGRSSPRSQIAWQDYVRQAAVIVMVAGLSGWAGWMAADRAQINVPVEASALSAHMRSLVQDSTTQIASSDRHTVRPWFAGRLEFAPAVQDLSAQGFPLQGGRLDVIGERRVAALVYKRRLHVINVFVWPIANDNSTEPRLTTTKGYNLLSWSRGGMRYVAVSDLNSAELRELQALL